MKKHEMKKTLSIGVCLLTALLAVSCYEESFSVRDDESSITSVLYFAETSSIPDSATEDSSIVDSVHFDGDVLETLGVDITVIETTTETNAETTTTTTETTFEETTTTKTTDPNPTRAEKTTTITTTTTHTQTTVPVEIKVVYKPRTHYFHTNSCRWYDNSCTEGYDLNDIYGRLCSECKPDIELVHVYEPTKEEPPKQGNGSLPITQKEFIMLANLVAHEYGADWVPTAEKAKVVMTVMNRVRSSKYPNNVRDVILQKNQYCWVPDSYYWKRTTQGCKDAVTYYFNNQSQFSTNLFSFWGDGRKNHFY